MAPNTHVGCAERTAADLKACASAADPFLETHSTNQLTSMRVPILLWQASWLVDWVAGWLAGWPVGWPAGWLAWLAGWLVGSLTGWLAGCRFFVSLVYGDCLVLFLYINETPVLRNKQLVGGIVKITSGCSDYLIWLLYFNVSVLFGVYF